jgi:hypothetical protein
MGEGRGVYRVLVRGKLCERYHWGHPGIDNIKMDLQEVICEGMDWIEWAWDRYRWQAVTNVVMNLWVPYSADNLLTS